MQAPFTPEQAKSINAYQTAGVMRPFTCGNDCGADLVAEESGMKCPRCDYSQNWVHPFMADWSWKPAPGTFPWLNDK